MKSRDTKERSHEMDHIQYKTSQKFIVIHQLIDLLCEFEV
jgi:hypothetical protein